MREVADMELLRQYAREGSETAFGTLTARHINLVYSAALRKTGNAAAAEEITQAVFIILANKAGGLRPGTILSGWLYQAVRLTAANYLRTEFRRIDREQEAFMQALTNETEAEVWLQLKPQLEDAMGRLGEKDRNAIVLRFFEGKSFQEVGAAFGVSENAAKKRVQHALTKLRKWFSRRGVVATTAVIAGAIAANSVHAAPAGLAVSLSASAVQGSAAAASIATLAKGAMKLMAWAKIKSAAWVGVAAILATGTTTVVVNQLVAQTGHAPVNLSSPPPAVAADPPGIEDSVWERPTDLVALPPVILVRPTHFAAPGRPEPVGGFRSTGGGPNGTPRSAILSVRYGEKNAMGYNGKLMLLAKAYPFARLIQMAYELDASGAALYPLSSQKLMALSPDACSNRYDVLMNVPNGSPALLAQAIKEQVGYAGHYEEVETNVLLLTMKNLGGPGFRTVGNGGNAAARGGMTINGRGGAGGAGGGGLSGISGPSLEVDGHYHGGGGGSSGGSGSQTRTYSSVVSFDNRRPGYHNIVFTNQPISHLVTDLNVYRFVTDPTGDVTRGDTSPTLFAPLIVDRTGLTGMYTVFVEWARSTDPATEEQAIQTALLKQLGLQLVPARERVKMLVVEKVK